MDNKLTRLTELSFGLKLVLIVSLIALIFNLVTQYQWLTLIDGINGAINIGIFSSLLGLTLIGIFGIMYEDAGKGEVKFQSKVWKQLLELLHYHYKLHPKLTACIYIFYSLPALFFYVFFGNLLFLYAKWGNDIWPGSGSSVSLSSLSGIEFILNWLAIFGIASMGLLAGLYLSKRSKNPIRYKIAILISLIACWGMYLFMAFARSRY